MEAFPALLSLKQKRKRQLVKVYSIQGVSHNTLTDAPSPPAEHHDHFLRKAEGAWQRAAGYLHRSTETNTITTSAMWQQICCILHCYEASAKRMADCLFAHNMGW